MAGNRAALGMIQHCDNPRSIARSNNPDICSGATRDGRESDGSCAPPENCPDRQSRRETPPRDPGTHPRICGARRLPPTNRSSARAREAFQTPASSHKQHGACRTQANTSRRVPGFRNANTVIERETPVSPSDSTLFHVGWPGVRNRRLSHKNGFAAPAPGAIHLSAERA